LCPATQRLLEDKDIGKPYRRLATVVNQDRDENFDGLEPKVLTQIKRWSIKNLLKHVQPGLAHLTGVSVHAQGESEQPFPDQARG
nr:hypothetical protein [Tanacetum cinerariifolium]